MQLLLSHQRACHVYTNLNADLYVNSVLHTYDTVNITKIVTTVLVLVTPTQNLTTPLVTTLTLKTTNTPAEYPLSPLSVHSVQTR